MLVSSGHLSPSNILFGAKRNKDLQNEGIHCGKSIISVDERLSYIILFQ